MTKKVFVRAELGIDGDHAFALVGDDLQSGECEFVKINYESNYRPRSQAEIGAAYAAYDKLKKRLGPLVDSFYFGHSHPLGD